MTDEQQGMCKYSLVHNFTEFDELYYIILFRDHDKLFVTEVIPNGCSSGKLILVENLFRCIYFHGL